MTDRIDVIVSSEVPLSAEEKLMGALPSARGAIARASHISLETAVIDANLREVVDRIASKLMAPEAPEKAYEINEIELGLAIDAKGSVSLIGSVEVGGSASIKVKIKRKPSKQ